MMTVMTHRLAPNKENIFLPASSLSVDTGRLSLVFPSLFLLVCLDCHGADRAAMGCRWDSI
jgi:hypothetical protein